MKSFQKFSLFIVLTLLLAACSSDGQQATAKSVGSESEYRETLPQELDTQSVELTISTEKNVYTLPVKKIVASMHNTGAEPLGYEAALHLEKLEDDIWYRIPYNALGFTDGLNVIEPGEEIFQEVPVDRLKFELTKGHYRIVKTIIHESEEYPLSVEFEIR